MIMWGILGEFVYICQDFGCNLDTNGLILVIMCLPTLCCLAFVPSMLPVRASDSITNFTANSFETLHAAFQALSEFRMRPTQ